MTKNRGLLAGVGMLLALTLPSSAGSQAVARQDPIPALIEGARQNGYNEGYIAGVEAAQWVGYPQCRAALSSCDARVERYARCMVDLRNALARDDAYLRVVAGECARLAPFGR